MIMFYIDDIQYSNVFYQTKPLQRANTHWRVNDLCFYFTTRTRRGQANKVISAVVVLRPTTNENAKVMVTVRYWSNVYS